MEERARATELLNQGLAEHRAETRQDREGEVTLAPYHPADLGTEAMAEEVDAANATRISEELAQITAALDRLYRTPELFGVSETTGQPIPFERLDLVPWARTGEPLRS